MGYYTVFNLSVRNLSKDGFNTLENLLREKEITNYALYDLEYYENDRTAEAYSYDMVKWYECTEDMRDISAKIPDAVFQISGNGEDEGDFWKEYYCNGDYEFCKGEITYAKPQKIHWDDSFSAYVNSLPSAVHEQ